ncbi:MAG: OmpA family protein [Bacteroidota bacterium]|nr:OmpA family protein [Bacteroidota bacterium]
MKAKVLILIFMFGFNLNDSVLGQMRKADRLYERFEYSKAIPCYIKVIQRNSKQKNQAILKLANCYRVNSQYTLAEKWYRLAITLPGVDPVNYLYYGQVLQSSGKYHEANQQFVKYSQLRPNDLIMSTVLFDENVLNSLLNNNKRCKIENALKLNSPYSDFSPVKYRDGIVFVSERNKIRKSWQYGWTGAGYLDLLMVQKGKNDSVQNAVHSFISTNKKYHVGPACFTRDFNKIYYTRTTRTEGNVESNRFRTSKLKIFQADYADGNWINEIPFPYNNESYSVGHPTLSGDGKTIFFVSDMPGGLGGTDLYVCHMKDGRWSRPENLGAAVNTKGNEMFPYLLNDTILYFSSTGHPGLGGLDIFRTVFRNGRWQQVENMKAPINSSADDFGILMSEKENSGIFSSNRTGGVGKDDLYYFNIEEKPILIKADPKTTFTYGYVKDEKTSQPIADATVFVWNTATSKIEVLKTNQEGYFSTIIDLKVRYVVKAMSYRYTNDCLSCVVNDSLPDNKFELGRVLYLNKLNQGETFKVENIYYDFNKWNIRPDAASELNKTIAFLKEYPQIRVELGSHTDCRGTSPYNMVLSQHRADAAVKYIVDHGISKSRIEAKGYGETCPVNRSKDGVLCSEAEYQANRRTELKVLNECSDNKNEEADPLLKYKNKEILKLTQLPSDFFIQCSETKLVDK